jgi:hypothetical protein
MDTSGWPKMPDQQRKRTAYVISYLETGDRKTARTVSGIKDNRTHNQIVDKLKKTGSLAESAHARQREKFTDDVMQAAQEYLVGEQDIPLSTADVVAYLEGQKILKSHTNKHNLLAAFTEWVVAQGLSLHVNSREHIFRITEKGAQERLEWVQYYNSKLGEEFQLRDMIIVDETTFEEGPHPKGKMLEPPCLSWCSM